MPHTALAPSCFHQAHDTTSWQAAQSVIPPCLDTSRPKAHNQYKQIPAAPVDYGYPDFKNFWFHRKTRMRAEHMQIINDKRAKEKAKK